MSTAYWLKCATHDEVSETESVNNQVRLAVVWQNRKRIVQAIKDLKECGIWREFRLDDCVPIWRETIDFLEEHTDCHVVIHDEYGHDQEIPDDLSKFRGQCG